MNRQIGKKLVAVLKILSKANRPLGARSISKMLAEMEGIHLTERAVRFYLELMDERGLTELVGEKGRLGRKLTEKGREELSNALVADKVGMVAGRMDELSYLTDFDINTKKGKIILNISLVSKSEFPKAIDIIKEVSESRISMGRLIITADEGEAIEDFVVPKGAKAIGTICAVTINGILLHHRIPVKSRFGGILQIEDHTPIRFTEIIEYSGSSLDPAEIFIKGKMTSVLNAVRTGSGKVLAGFREVPIVCLPEVEKILNELEKLGMSGAVAIGEPNQPTLQIPVTSGYAGLVILAGLNPLAAVEECGINTQNMSLSTMVEFEKLKPVDSL